MTSLLAFVAFFAIVQAPNVAPLARGAADDLLVTGAITGKRATAASGGEESYRVFNVENADVALFIRLNSADGVARRWDDALTKATRVTMRIMPRGADLIGPNDPRATSDVLCVIQAAERSGQFSMFALSCTSREPRPDGKLLRDVGIAVAAKRNSSSEAFFLALDRQSVLAKLEI